MRKSNSSREPIAYLSIIKKNGRPGYKPLFDWHEVDANPGCKVRKGIIRQPLEAANKIDFLKEGPAQEADPFRLMRLSDAWSKTTPPGPKDEGE